MTTNSKYNLYIWLIWLGFCLITVVFGLFLADSIDWHPCVWKTILGVVGYIVLIFGTVVFGRYVNTVRAIELSAEKAKK